MKKYYIIGAIMLVLAGVVYFTGLYTYFQSTEVNEALPNSNGSSQTEVAPQTLFQGTFVGVDLVHKGSGTA